MKPPYTIEKRGRAIVGYMRGLTHRNYEDRFRLLSAEVPIVAEAGRGEMFAVFDGMGGLRQGMHAAQHMADLLIEFFEFPHRHEATVLGVTQLLLRGSSEIEEWGQEPDSANPRGGCVGTVVWLREAKACVFHAGDTECWVSNRPGQSGKVTDTQALGGRVTQYFGMRAPLLIQTLTFSFTGNMRILLTSDGTKTARVTHALGERLAERRAASLIVTEICEAAAFAQAPDDITVMLIDADPAPAAGASRLA